MIKKQMVGRLMAITSYQAEQTRIRNTLWHYAKGYPILLFESITKELQAAAMKEKKWFDELKEMNA